MCGVCDTVPYPPALKQVFIDLHAFLCVRVCMYVVFVYSRDTCDMSGQNLAVQSANGFDWCWYGVLMHLIA